MREIKFRAYHKGDKEWITFVISPTEENIDITTSFGSRYHVRLLINKEIDDIYYEFTGLLDCNEKEIYEGDIVTFYSQGQYFYREVVWNADKAMFSLRDVKGNVNGWHLNSDNYEVVGNVYEHPQLLR